MNDYSHNFPSTPNLAQKGSVFEDMAWIVSSTVDVSYDVSIQERIFDTENTSLKNKIGELGDARQLIFLDENVERLHGDRIAAYFETHNIPVTIHIVTVSEEKKSLETALNLLRHLEENNTLRRSAPFIAIGGGVLLDLAGFAASLYRRGIPHIRIPTNLMALIDASIGVKSGINIWDRRNRLGTYNAPGSVLLDRSFLKTVCARELSNGLAEILKLAVIKDAELFGLLESAGSHLISSKMQDDEFSPSVIARAAHGMLEELAPNLWERKLERCVDFGHSFSPMVEMLSLPERASGRRDRCAGLGHDVGRFGAKLGLQRTQRAQHIVRFVGREKRFTTLGQNPAGLSRIGEEGNRIGRAAKDSGAQVFRHLDSHVDGVGYAGDDGAPGAAFGTSGPISRAPVLAAMRAAMDSPGSTSPGPPTKKAVSAPLRR